MARDAEVRPRNSPWPLAKASVDRAGPRDERKGAPRHPPVEKLGWAPLAGILAFRLVLAITVTTSESPDEWWQSLEVAYNIVFGKGLLSWEWQQGIRPFTFPLVFAVPFWILKGLGLDTAFLVWLAPRLVMALVSAIIDVCTFNLGARFDAALRHGPTAANGDADDAAGKQKAQRGPRGGRWWGNVAHFSLLLSISNGYWGYICTRAYSNVFEALLVLLALLEVDYLPFLFWAGLACSMRITSAVPILPQAVYHLHRAVRDRGGLFRGLGYFAAWGVVFVVLNFAAMAVVDYVFHRRWLCTTFNFLLFNVLENSSRFFGTSPWYWYIVWAVPVLLGFSLPMVLYSPCLCFVAPLKHANPEARWQVWKLLATVLWTTAGYSMLEHKEMRFLVTIIPLSTVLAGVAVSHLYSQHRWVRRLLRYGMILNIVVFVFFAYGYRCGMVTAMKDLQHGPKIASLDIVTNCFASPGYSHVHGVVDDLNVLNCPMSINRDTGLPYQTESTLFLARPAQFVSWRYDGTHTLNETSQEDLAYLANLKAVVPPASRPVPEAIITFTQTAESIFELFLEKHGFQHVHTYYHTIAVYDSTEDVTLELWHRKRNALM